MLKGKNLYYVLGLGAVAYYFFYMNKKKKAMSTPSTAPANFTGDLDVFDYQSADGRMTDRQIRRIANAKGERANRIYGRIASRRGLL
jgi:hypothetical protein